MTTFFSPKTCIEETFTGFHLSSCDNYSEAQSNFIYVVILCVVHFQLPWVFLFFYLCLLLFELSRISRVVIPKCVYQKCVQRMCGWPERKSHTQPHYVRASVQHCGNRNLSSKCNDRVLFFHTHIVVVHTFLLNLPCVVCHEENDKINMEIAGICDHLKFVVKMHFDNNNAAIVHYASIPMQTSMICDEKRKEKSKVMGISFRSE